MSSLARSSNSSGRIGRSIPPNLRMDLRVRAQGEDLPIPWNLRRDLRVRAQGEDLSMKKISMVFPGKKMTGSKMTGSKMTGSKMTGSKMTGSKMTGSKMTGGKSVMGGCGRRTVEPTGVAGGGMRMKAAGVALPGMMRAGATARTVK